MTFEKFYFTQKVLERYREIGKLLGDPASYADMYRVTENCWEEFCDSNYHQFQLKKEGLGIAVEEYVTEADFNHK